MTVRVSNSLVFSSYYGNSINEFICGLNDQLNVPLYDFQLPYVGFNLNASSSFAKNDHLGLSLSYYAFDLD